MICNSLLLAMSRENFSLALGGSVPVRPWALYWAGSVYPLVNANMDVLFSALSSPNRVGGAFMRARNYAKVFTIPWATFWEAFWLDSSWKGLWRLPRATGSGLLPALLLFGRGKGSSAALLFLFWQWPGRRCAC